MAAASVRRFPRTDAPDRLRKLSTTNPVATPMNDQMSLSMSEISNAMQADRKSASKQLAAIHRHPTGMREGFGVYSLKSIVEVFNHTASRRYLDSMAPFQHKAWIASARDRLRLETKRGNCRASWTWQP